MAQGMEIRPYPSPSSYTVKQKIQLQLDKTISSRNIK